jgi:hypothetical protein
MYWREHVRRRVIGMPVDNLAPAARAISGSHVVIASFRREESVLDVPWRTYITDVFLKCDEPSGESVRE